MSNYNRTSSDAPVGCIAAIVVAAIIAFLGLIVFVGGTARVGNNEVGVINNQGAIDKNQTPLTPGWHFIMPGFQGADTVNVSQQSHEFSEVQTATHNQQTVYVDGTVSYHVDSSKAAELVIQGGAEQVIGRILWPAFQDYIKEITPTYADYSDVLINREKIRNDVRTRLQGKTDPYGLFVDDVFMTNIHPEKSYQDSINNAAKAQQDLVTAQNEAKAKIAAAVGDAQANAIRQQTITPQVLAQQALANQAAAIVKWDGKYPNTYVTNGASGGDPLSLILNGASLTK